MLTVPGLHFPFTVSVFHSQPSTHCEPVIDNIDSKSSAFCVI